MYLRYFGLNERPFAITPDPAFVFLSDRHRDALAHLLFGIGQGGSGGFVQLTGEVGTGKTTLCRCLLEQVPEDARIALVLNPLVSASELLESICEELGVETEGTQGSAKKLVDRLSHYLLDAHQSGARVVVVIDEAQNLSPEALEQVRLLTNLETSKEKLLQIVLLGQPELRDLLQRRDLRQLAQRITARYHLTPLGLKDTRRYVGHRMNVAGAERNPFKSGAVKAIFQRSHGVPRLINIIADRALLGAYASEATMVDARMVHAAADEIQQGEPGMRRRIWPWALSGSVLASLLVLLGSGLDFRTVPQVSSPPAVDSTQTAEPVAQPVAVEPAPVARETSNDRSAFSGSLDDQWLAQQSAAAWRGLAETWGNVEDAWEIQGACQGRNDVGFACVYNQGTWLRIERLGLPVVLILGPGEEQFLLLRGMQSDVLLVGTPGESRAVLKQTLESRWLGAYLVAWPQPAGWPGEIKRGDTGPAFETVFEMAKNADQPFQGPLVFDARFEQWLVQFQQRHGLEADGIVGPKTLLYLMKYVISEPGLLRSWSVPDEV